jgi:hypothetical protein
VDGLGTTTVSGTSDDYLGAGTIVSASVEVGTTFIGFGTTVSTSLPSFDTILTGFGTMVSTSDGYGLGGYGCTGSTS